MVGVGGASGGGVSWTLKKAAKKILVQTCGGSFSWTTSTTDSSTSSASRHNLQVQDDDRQTSASTSTSTNNANAAAVHVLPSDSSLVNSSNASRHQIFSHVLYQEQGDADASFFLNAKFITPLQHSSASYINICAICLDPLNYSSGGTPSPAIFTAQCSHAFHFSCISSSVCHGNVTCPICRAHWTHLPRNLNSRCSLQSKQSDPILQILDDSIASFRVHRRSFLLSARYDDDDPVEPNYALHNLRLRFSLVHFHITHPSIHLFPRKKNGVKLCPSPLLVERSSLPDSDHLCTSEQDPFFSTASVGACLCVRLERQPATDLVLVASPSGQHLRLLKQAMALVILSLRPEDRLSIVTYSSAAARMFPLKRMTSYGKRSALQVIDRLFYMGSADPTVGVKKGLKVLSDRVYRNPESYILHLSDSPTWSSENLCSGEAAVKIYRFHVGFGFSTSHGFVMHEFEEFLAGMLGGAITDIQLKVKDNTRIIKLGELRGGEERRIPLLLHKSTQYSVEYSYIDGGIEERTKTGEMVIGFPDQSDINDGFGIGGSPSGRTSSAESWEYHDAFMARRWAKHLHGNRL